MKSVVDDRGSFTIEASIISVFIVMVVANLIVLTLYAHDICIINEQVNRYILVINKYIIDNMSDGNEDNKDKLSVIDKLEKDFKTNCKVVYIDIGSVSYNIKDSRISVIVKYNLDDNLGYSLRGGKRTCNLERWFYSYNVKNEVRNIV